MELWKPRADDLHSRSCCRTNARVSAGRSDALARLFVPGLAIGVRRSVGRADQAYFLAATHCSLLASCASSTGRGLINDEAIVLDEKARSDFAELGRQSRDASLISISSIAAAKGLMGWRTSRYFHSNLSVGSRLD